MLSHDLLAKHETNKTYCWNTHSSKRSRVEEDITEYSSTSKRRIQQQRKNTAAEQQYEKKTLHDNWCCFRRGRPSTSPPLQLNDAELWVLLSRIFSEIETQVQCGTLEPGAAQNQRLKGSTGSDSFTLSHFHLLFVGL